MLEKTLNKAARLRISCKSKKCANMSYWQDIVNVLKQDDVLKDWLEADNEATLLEKVSATDMKDWSEFFVYQGFNVIRILRQIKSNYDTYMNDASNAANAFKYKILVNNKYEEKEYTNRENLSRDLHFLITVFVIRGNNIDKIFQKSDNELSQILEMLREKIGLDVDKHDPNQALGDKVITIPRICACFPTITCNLYHAGIGKLLVSFTDLGLVDTVTKAVLSPFFTSCIYRGALSKNTNENMLFFVVHICIDNVIHKKDKKYTGLMEMLAYYKAAFESPATPELARKKFCGGLDLLDAARKIFNAEIRQAALTAEDRINNLRPNDPNLGSVIAQLKELY